MAKPKYHEITWAPSLSPYAPIVRIRQPEELPLPAAGVWRLAKAPGEIIFTLDTSQSVDGWLAYAIFGRHLKHHPFDDISVVEALDGNRESLWLGYVRPGVALSFGVGRGRRQKVDFVIAGPGSTRTAMAKDFAAKRKPALP